ncbi:hypothetical protein B0H17DRAFT_1335743 [Mycena rosella]|uniref:BTB domain-containing protein n=1 Tax=Mycena rosella TaxID=1033263 RepID=A0AAD7CXS1_MYCRO|nr:hypothetical protein B0H17DRAFT_1335743 [Mycena rosella]
MDATELVRSTEFWFEDGTVILQVENMLYRVYRGLLSSRSAVFRDTFSIPQPQAAGDRNEIEGCPVVQLHEKAKDFAHFLRALHHYGSHKTCAVSGIFTLTSVIRLSDKYDAALLRHSMVEILSDLYPSALHKWRARDDAVPAGYNAQLIDHIPALNIARKMDIRSILPGVMYEVCCWNSLEEILYGVSASEKHALKTIDNVEDRKRCALAIPHLISAQRLVFTNYLTPGEDDANPECADIAACDAERLRWLAIDLPTVENMDVLDEELAWESFAVCSSCLDAAKDTYTEDREAVWNRLPSIFNLGTWEELLA